MWQSYIKFIKEPVMMDLLPNTHGQTGSAHTTGEDSRVTITSAGLETRTIRGANLLPHLPNDILTALERYGAIGGSKMVPGSKHIGTLLVTE
jgi:hypothetical protein